jgi:hypothetical protein
MNETCKHNIYPKESCSYCSGLRKKSDFSGIAKEDTFTHLTSSVSRRSPKKVWDKESKVWVYEGFDQDKDYIDSNVS